MRKLRIFEPMLWRLSAGIFALVLLLAAVIPVLADTGTYEITNYIVTLEPQSDGQVKLTYEQDWKVLSGDIPWVTVGLPNNNFSVESRSGAAASVSSANSNGFSGVRVDLDKDYQAGQTFNITFTVLQSGLLERLTADKKWRINYTPGWYDSAKIDNLQINLVSPVAYQTYSSLNPAPVSINNNIFTWEQSNLSPGARFNINVESLDGSFLTATAPSNPSQSNGFGLKFFIIVAVILLAGFLVFWGLRKYRQAQESAVKERVATLEREMSEDKKKKKEVEEGFEEYVEKKKLEPDAQGRYYDRGYGNYITPAIWAAVIVPRIAHSSNPNPPPDGGQGGCACACVSCACACACACAGGGAAGCSRKSLHDCQSCSVFKDKTSKI